ncbi:MAG: type VI secretion system membrane subunit TssM [Methylococcaceae bacterium]|nr:type VI secretion system membrane subunit TssM [Methylococcaceae bacterium]
MIYRFLAWLGRLRIYFRLLEPIWKHVKNSIPVLLFLGFTISLVAVWWLGPKWEFRGAFPLGSTLSRVLVTIFIFLIAAVGYGFYSRRKVKNLEQEKLDAEEADAARPYIEALEGRLDDSLLLLKDNLKVKNFLYKLPWYMVIGVEDSGKTSLVNRSGQKFELTTVTNASGKTDGIRRRRDAVNLPHDIDWWISHDAILIDPDGLLITQRPTADETNSRLAERLWLHFIEWVGKTRNKRPLNGVILTIDFAKLASQQASDRKAYSTILRARLRETMEQLGTRLPVYVVLTKFDLIKGFDTFFQNISKSQRDEVFGITFTFDAKADDNDWLDELDVWYDKFISIINEESFDLMAKATTLRERENLFSFARELIGIKQALQEFLADVLESDPYSTPALVRGLYFTSVYQHGIPSNPFEDASSKNYQMPLVASTAFPATSSAIYFARSLFFKVIYPEAGLAGDNQQVVDKRNKVIKIAAVVAGIGLSTLIGGWQYYYLRNSRSTDIALTESVAFNSIDISDRIDTTGKKLLPPLNHIRKAAMVYADYGDKWPVVAEMGLYQGRTIGPETVQAYQDQLATRFLPELGAGVVEFINASPKASNDKLMALRVYRMIEDMENRRKKIVVDWMAKLWQDKFPEKRPIQEQLMVHLDYAMDHVKADLPAYKRWVTDTQKELLTIPLTNRVYRTMKQNAASEFASPLDLRAAIGPAFDIIYKNESERRRPTVEEEIESFTEEPNFIEKEDSENNIVENSYLIPAMLTAAGFKDYFVEQNDNITDIALVDSWVLGIRDSVKYSKEDEKMLRTKIRTMYVADYINTWEETLNRLEVQEFKNIPHAVKILKSLVGKYQPLQRMVNTVQDNSQIYAPASKDKEAKAALQTDPNRKRAHEIDQAFSSLANLTKAKEKTPPYLQEVVKSIDAVYDYMLTIQDASDQGGKALQATQDRFALRGSDPITVLERIADGLPEPLNIQLRDVAKQSWQVVLIRALQELERKWDADVYQFFEQRLKYKYPFQKNRQDAAIKDFEAFFGSKGILSTFYNDHLRVFLEDNLDALYSEDRGEYLINTDLIKQLDKAWAIEEAFFNTQGALHVPYSIEPMGLSGTSRRSVLNADGQIIPYNHGSTYPVDMLWPNTLRKKAESKVVVVNRRGESQMIKYNGPWSWFRLVQHANQKRAANNSLILSYSLNGSVMKYQLHSDSSNNPFSSNQLRHYKLPQFLLNKPKTTEEVKNRSPKEAIKKIKKAMAERQ